MYKIAILSKLLLLGLLNEKEPSIEFKHGVFKISASIDKEYLSLYLELNKDSDKLMLLFDLASKKLCSPYRIKNLYEESDLEELTINIDNRDYNIGIFGIDRNLLIKNQEESFFILTQVSLIEINSDTIKFILNHEDLNNDEDIKIAFVGGCLHLYYDVGDEVNLVQI